MGYLETVLAERATALLWRLGRAVRYESEVVSMAVEKAGDARQEGTDILSSIIPKSLLKYQDNPLILREAILMLSVERFGLEKFGFRRDPPWILRRLYGLDHEDAAPFGTIFHMYLNCAQSEGRPETTVSQADVESEEDRKNQMLKILDDEIKRLEEMREQALARCIERIEYNKLTHLVPPAPVSERLLRYETHLSREFDRTLSQLERLQRMRLGQPVIPSINLRLSR